MMLRLQFNECVALSFCIRPWITAPRRPLCFEKEVDGSEEILRSCLPGWVAGWPWNQWPDARGMGGRINVESVVRCSWNGWPDDRGIRRQRVGRLLFQVVQAAGDQRLLGVAVQEADQHLHAHPGDGQRAVLAAGPAGSHAQPGAAGLFRGFALPVELHLDAAVFVAVDLLRRRALVRCRADDFRALAAEQARARMQGGQAKGLVAGDGAEAVAI